jgi:hypothetical protein
MDLPSPQQPPASFMDSSKGQPEPLPFAKKGWIKPFFKPYKILKININHLDVSEISVPQTIQYFIDSPDRPSYTSIP